ncbi:MAG: winged helix-turn-helix domain-containing protein [Candidatus Sulfotelmatobacter sp.]
MVEVEKRVFRFGVFEADTSSGELRKSGMRLRMQEKPFQVLILLLAHAGEVVTREEICQKLWASDTFVDFDHSLNTIINKIREGLGDSAANPRFIETLAKRGYRFLVPVEAVSHPPAAFSSKADPPAPSTQETSHTSIFRLSRQEELPAVSLSYVRALFLLIQIMYLVFYVIALARLPVVEDLLERALGGRPVAIIVLIASAGVGIPIRLYLLSAMSFSIQDLSAKFRRLFPGLLVLDELWALSPFLLAPQIGLGLALGMTAALIYLPFAQRALVLMRERSQSAQ